MSLKTSRPRAKLNGMINDTHRILFLVANDFQSMDLFGPLDAFDAARELAGARYSLAIAALDNKPVTTETGVPIVPDCWINEETPVDTLIICGGRGPRTGTFTEKQIEALRQAATRAERVISICTGAFLLARTGLADGRKIATHWRYASELAQGYPRIKVEADPIFLCDGKFWSSAGVTAGIDLSLALIAQDIGKPAAAAVARQLVVYLHRPGNQAQYSDPLSAQFSANERFGELVHWITNNLSRPLTVETLAERVALTPRHFTRLFRDIFGQPPGRFVENLRLGRARLLLAEEKTRIEDVANQVGYTSAASFRRAFERRFSMTPTQYQARFDYPGTQDSHL